LFLGAGALLALSTVASNGKPTNLKRLPAPALAAGSRLLEKLDQH